MRARVPAVVVGGSLNALGVVRSLARARVPVFLIETTRACPAAWSRHCRFIRTPGFHGEALLNCLLSLAAELDCRPALLLTRDDSVATVSACRERLSFAYCIDLPSIETVGALADKAEFHQLAERCGFPVPRGIVLRCEGDFERITALKPPFVVKPADQRRVLWGEVDRIALEESIEKAHAAAARLLTRAPPLIVQEWIEGDDDDIYFTLFACDAESRLVGIFTGRKIVCSPPLIGSTAACVPAPEVADALGRETARFIAHFGYRGLGSLEFKRDRRTGRYLIIEPTVGRTDWQQEIATLCGINLPVLAYRTALGQTLSATPPSGSRRIIWRDSFETRLPGSAADGLAKVIDGYFRWADPLPALYYYGYERFALSVWRRACRTLNPAPWRTPKAS